MKRWVGPAHPGRSQETRARGVPSLPHRRSKYPTSVGVGRQDLSLQNYRLRSLCALQSNCWVLMPCSTHCSSSSNVPADTNASAPASLSERQTLILPPSTNMVRDPRARSEPSGHVSSLRNSPSAWSSGGNDSSTDSVCSTPGTPFAGALCKYRAITTISFGRFGRKPK